MIVEKRGEDMAFALWAKNVRFPNCNYEGKAILQGLSSIIALVLFVSSSRRLSGIKIRNGRVKMHLEKRNNQRIDFGILVHYNHKRRMTKLRDLTKIPRNFWK